MLQRGAANRSRGAAALSAASLDRPDDERGERMFKPKGDVEFLRPIAERHDGLIRKRISEARAIVDEWTRILWRVHKASRGWDNEREQFALAAERRGGSFPDAGPEGAISIVVRDATIPWPYMRDIYVVLPPHLMPGQGPRRFLPIPIPLDTRVDYLDKFAALSAIRDALIPDVEKVYPPKEQLWEPIIDDECRGGRIGTRWLRYHELIRDLGLLKESDKYTLGRWCDEVAERFAGDSTKATAATVVTPIVPAAIPETPASDRRTTNQKMREAYYEAPTNRIEWSASQWAQFCKCSKSTVHGCEMWREIIGMRELARAQSVVKAMAKDKQPARRRSGKADLG